MIKQHQNSERMMTDNQNRQKYVIYPYQLVQTDKKLAQAQRLLLKIIQQSYEKQIRDKGDSSGVQESRKININQGRNLYHQVNQDQLVRRNLAYIDKCRIFYQTKLVEERNRYQQIIAEKQQRLKNLGEQLSTKQKQVQKYEKLQHLNKQQIKRVHKQSQQIKNKRSMQKQRITQMFIKQKQQLFNKYSNMEKQSMVLLEFLNKIEDITQRKGDDQLNKLAFIQQVQLEATNYYSNLSIPLIQEILNTFTQDFNYLYNKFQKMERSDSKSRAKEHSNQKPSKISLKKLKQYKNQTTSTSINSQSQQLTSLKQQLSSIQKKLQEDTKQMQQVVEHERENSKNLKKKIQKYEMQIKNNNKELEHHFEREEDLKKKINRLQKQIFDYKSKVKIQDEEIEVYENYRGLSLPNIDVQFQRKSKQGNNRQQLKKQQGSQTITQQQNNHQLIRLKQEIQNLSRTTKDKLEEKSLQSQKHRKYILQMENLNGIKLRQKQQQLANIKKIMNVKQTQIMWLQERLKKNINQLSTKSDQVQANRIAMTNLQEQLKIVQLYCAETEQQKQSLNKIISQLQNNQYEVEQLSAELNTKCEKIRGLEDKLEKYKLIYDRYQKEQIRDSQQESMKDKQIIKLKEQLSKYIKQERENKQKQVNKKFSQLKQKQVANQKQKKSEQDKQELKQSHENTSSLQKQVFQLITKLEQKTKGYNHFKTQNQKCEKQIIHLQNKYKALKQKQCMIEKQLESKSTIISYVDEQIQTQIIQTERSQINRLTNKIESLEKIIEQNNRTIDRDIIIILQNQQELQNKQKQLQILQQQLVIKQEQMRDIVTKSTEQQHKNRNMQILQIEKQLENKINAIQEQSQTFQHKYQQVANQLTQNKTVLATKLQECDTLQSEILRLGEILNMKTQQNEEMKAKLQSIEDKNHDKNTKDEQMKVNTGQDKEQIELIKKLREDLILKEDKLTHIQQQYRNVNEILIQKDQQLRQITQHKFQQKCGQLKKQNQQLLLSATKMQEFIQSKQQENAQLKQTINNLLKQRNDIQSVSQSVQGNANINMNICESAQKKQQTKQQNQQKDKQKPFQNENENNLNTTEMEISQNMISSKQLNMMQQEISNFKEQLNGLMATIQNKDDTILQLKKQLADLSTSLQVNKKGEEKGYSNEQNSPMNKTTRQQKMQSQISKLTEKLIEKQNQLEKANIKMTKQEILTSKINELQKKLDSQKQLYQNQINKCNIRIIELQNQVRKQKQEYDSRKRKVFSEEYYSIDPKINIFQSKPKTNEEVSNNFNPPQNQAEQNKSEDYHSIQDDSHEDNKLKTQEQIQLEQKQENKTQTKIRKQKSQQYERRKSGLTKLQKLASIERRYDSDQKSKQQKDMKALMAMRSQEQSPIINSSLQNKLLNNLKNQKQIARHHPISNDDAHHYPVSEYGLNEMMRNLTQQNRQLKFINEKLTKDLKNLLQFVEILSKRWKNHKEIESNSEAGKMIALERLQENIKLLEISKVKILQEFNPNDLQNIFDNVTQLVNETKRWINIIEKLITQNKKMNLQMILNKNFPKLVKTKTNKYGVGEQNHRRSRSVYSQGNVYRQHHIDMDQSPFQIQQQHPQPQHHVQHLQPNNSHQQTMTNIPTSSLEILFRQNNQMSEISSVKHKSFNSGFLNSKSQIAKMFQKGEKFGIEHRDQKKDNQIKKDIVDQYLIQNQKIQKIDKQKQKIEKQRQKFEKQKFDKNKNNNVSTIQNISSSTNKVYQSRIHSSAWQNSPLMHKTNQLEAKRIHKFQQKSNKAKTDFLIMLYNKLEMAKKQVENNKKQYTQFIKGLIQKNEMKVLATKNQFEQVMKKMISNHFIVDENNKIKDAMENNGEIFKKPTSKGNIPGRISQKDEQMYERLEQMQQKIQNKKKQIEDKQKIILEGRELLKELEKKLKEQKASHQSTKKKFASQATNSMFLKLKIEKLQTDFKKFMTKASNAGLQNFTILKSEAEAQANIFKDETQPLQKGKTFLKGKKIAKAETLPEKQQNKTSLLNSINKTFCAQKIQDESIVQNYNANNSELFLSYSKEKIKEGECQSPKKDKEKGKQSIWVNQNYQSELPLFKRSSSLVYSPQKQVGTQQQFQQISKIKQKKEEQLQLSIVRIKSEDMRQSKNPPSDMKLLNPSDRNTIKRKKTISQASQKQKVTHYQKQLKQLYALLKQALEDTPLRWIQMKQKQQQDNKSQKSENESKKNGQSGSRAKKFSEQQIEQEKSIKFEEQIRKIIKDLNEKLKEYKFDMEKSVKQREEKLKDIFKQIIETYKISLRTINKMIDKKVSGDNIYINQRLFFKNLFTEIKSIKAQRWSIADNLQEEQEGKFETFEDKYKTLVDENTRIKKQLEQRSKQCENLKKQANSDDNRKYLSHKSLVSNQNEENFHDFENKELFDNTKPSFQLLQELRKELNIYKKKCQEYQTINSKKKKQNFKVIRKWD